MRQASQMMQEFKEFILKGNIIDMAVGVIIGGAFSKIVTSLVNDIFMPVLGLITGGINFSGLKWVIEPAVYDTAGKQIIQETAILYGSFFQNVIDFLLIGICMFFTIKTVAKVSSKKKVMKITEEKCPPPPTTEELLMDIRDYLKNGVIKGN